MGKYDGTPTGEWIKEQRDRAKASLPPLPEKLTAEEWHARWEAVSDAMAVVLVQLEQLLRRTLDKRDPLPIPKNRHMHVFLKLVDIADEEKKEATR